MELNSIFMILTLHFLSDFILQSNWMAQNKSSSNKALGLHIFIYSVPFLLIGWKYAILNGVFHFITDYITSRITKKLWSKGDVHNFFVIIGLDQLLHYTALLGTYYLGIR